MSLKELHFLMLRRGRAIVPREANQLRNLLLLASFLLLAINAHAHPKNMTRIVTAAPRAVGRTAENMVTFGDRRLALNQWILMTAVLIDAKTSFDLTRRCPEPCENYSFVWGAHPPAARVYGLLGLTGMYYATINQAAWEISYTETNPSARAFERYFFLFPSRHCTDGLPSEMPRFSQQAPSHLRGKPICHPS